MAEVRPDPGIGFLDGAAILAPGREATTPVKGSKAEVAAVDTLRNHSDQIE